MICCHVRFVGNYHIRSYPIPTPILYGNVLNNVIDGEADHPAKLIMNFRLINFKTTL